MEIATLIHVSRWKLPVEQCEFRPWHVFIRSKVSACEFLARSVRMLVYMACVLVGPALADVSGRVVSVADGDTLIILEGTTQHKIRLSGIDAPERGQPWGDKAKANLGALAFDKMAEAHCHKADRYGRQVCVVAVVGKDVGLEQVRAGLAWWYRDYAKEQAPADRASYEAAETDAKLHRRGLWADARPAAPWEWRRSKRQGDQ